MWDDSQDGGDDDTQDAAKCNTKYTRWILHAIQKIRSQRWRPSVDRICREVLRYHPKAVEGDVQKQLELCVQEGKVVKLIHKGHPSYRDPGVYKPKNLRALMEIAISASTCKQGASFVTIEKYIKKSYPDELRRCTFNSEFRSQLAAALRTGVTSGRLVTDGFVYRIAESSCLPTNDNDLRIASPKKRKHVPRISGSSAPLAKKRRKFVPRISERSAQLAKKRKTVNSSAAVITVRKGYANQPVLGIVESSKLLADKGEHAQRTVDNCVTPVKKGKKYKKTNKKTLKAASPSEELQVDQSKYTEWILNAICKIKQDKQRPCEDRICREVLKVHQDAKVQEIKEHLDLCTQEGKILKVSFKYNDSTSISYRIPDVLSIDHKYIARHKRISLQRLEAAITNLAEEGGSSLKSIKKYMGNSCNINLLREVTKEGVACGRLQKDGSLYRIAQNTHKPSCVGKKLDGNVGMIYKAQAEKVDTTPSATSISQETKMDIHYSATITQDLSHLELLVPPRCKYCRRYFPSMSRYLIHKRRHEKTIRPYWYRKPCKLCGRPAKSAGRKKCHSNLCSSCNINSSQNSVKPYRAATMWRACDKCRGIFLNLDLLKEHKCKPYLPEKTVAKRGRCAKCGYVRVKHEKCAQLCKPCSKSLIEQGMTEYVLSHLEWTLYKCKICSRYFFHAEKLKEHEMIKHKKICVACGNKRKVRKYPQLCKPCGAAQEEQEMTYLGMTEHDLQVKVHKCQWCNETFPNLVQLKKHEVFQHSGQCAGCGSVGFMQHPRLCKLCVDSVKTFKIMNQDWEKKVYRCKSKTCNKWFLHLDLLKEHELKEHGITMIKCVVCGNHRTRHEKHPQICKQCYDSVTDGTMMSKVVFAETQPNVPDLQPNEPVIWIPITKCEWCGEQRLKHDDQPRLCKKCYELGITNEDLEEKRCRTCKKWFLYREKLTEHELREHGITCVMCGNQSTRHEKHPQLCKKCHESVAGTTTSKVMLTDKNPNEPGLRIPITKCVLCGQLTAEHKEHPLLCKKCNTSVSLIAAKHQPQEQEIIACEWCGEQNSQLDEHPRLCKNCRELGITNQDLKRRRCKTCNKWFDPEKLTEHEFRKHSIICLVCGNRSIRYKTHPQICKKCFKSVANLDDTKTSKIVLAENRPNGPVLWIPLTKCVLCCQPTAKHEEHSHLCINCNKTLMGGLGATKQPQNSTVQITCVMNKPVSLTGAKSASQGQEGNLNAQVTCDVNKPVTLTVAMSAFKGHVENSKKPVSLTAVKSASQGQVGNSNAQVTCVVCGKRSAASGKQVCMNCNQSSSSVPAKKESLGQVKKSTEEVKCDELPSSMDEENTHQKQEFIACEYCGEHSVKHDEHPSLCKKCYKSWSAAKSNKAGQESSKFVDKVMSNTKSSPQERSLVLYKCWHCSKAFLQFDELMAHKTAVHQQVTIPTVRIKTKSPQKQAVINVIYGCNFCSKTFLQSNNLKAHKMVEHWKLETTGIRKVPTKTVSWIICNQCGHLTRKTEEKQLTCSRCIGSGNM